MDYSRLAASDNSGSGWGWGSWSSGAWPWFSWFASSGVTEGTVWVASPSLDAAGRVEVDDCSGLTDAEESADWVDGSSCCCPWATPSDASWSWLCVDVDGSWPAMPGGEAIEVEGGGGGVEWDGISSSFAASPCTWSDVLDASCCWLLDVCGSICWCWASVMDRRGGRREEEDEDQDAIQRRLSPRWREESSAESHLDAIVTVDLDVIECSDCHSVLPWIDSPFRRLRVIVVEEQKLSVFTAGKFSELGFRLDFLSFLLLSLFSSSSFFILRTLFISISSDIHRDPQQISREASNAPPKVRSHQDRRWLLDSSSRLQSFRFKHQS